MFLLHPNQTPRIWTPPILQQYFHLKCKLRAYMRGGWFIGLSLYRKFTISWWTSLAEPRGSEPGFRRPIVIISSNEFNQSKIQTIIVAAITSNALLSEAPGNFKLTKKSSDLSRDSVVNVSQILTIDKSFLTEKSGKLKTKQTQLLNYGLQLALSI